MSRPLPSFPHLSRLRESLGQGFSDTFYSQLVMTQEAKIEETEAAADFPKMNENAVKFMNTRAIV